MAAHNELVKLESESVRLDIRAFYAAFNNMPYALAAHYDEFSEKTHGGMSLLAYATWGNAPETLKYCLQRTKGGYNDKSTLPPMITAVLQNCVRSFFVFVSNKEYHHHFFMCEKKTGRNAFHYAVITGNVFMIRMMMMICPKLIFVKCGNGWTPFQYAVYTKHYDIVKLLAPYHDMNEIRECINIAHNSGFRDIEDLLCNYFHTQQIVSIHDDDVIQGAYWLHAITLAD